MRARSAATHAQYGVADEGIAQREQLSLDPRRTRRYRFVLLLLNGLALDGNVAVAVVVVVVVAAAAERGDNPSRKALWRIALPATELALPSL